MLIVGHGGLIKISFFWKGFWETFSFSGTKDLLRKYHKMLYNR